MAHILILATPSTERDGLALFMEFAGHQCQAADSLPEALRIIKGGSFNLALVDPSIGDGESGQVGRAVKEVAPDVTVIDLAEEGSSPPATEDVITSPLTSLPGISPHYPALRKGEALLVFLPEKVSLKMLGDLPPSAGLLNKLGVLHQSQEKYQAAEQLYQRALELAKKASPDRERNEASILMNLASLYQAQQRLAEAEPLYRRSLELAEKVHGPTHAKVARRLRRLGEVYRLMGKQKDAARISERLQQMG